MKFFSSIKNISKFKINLNIPMSLLLIFLISILITMVLFYMKPVPTTQTLEIMAQSNFLMFFMNFIPIFLILIFLFFLFNNIIAPSGITFIIIFMLSIINRFKIELRNDPLFPWDFDLASEFFGISASFPFYYFIFLFLFVVTITLLTVFGYLKIKTKKINIKIRLTLIFISLITIYITNLTFFYNPDIINSLPIEGNVLNPVNQFNSRGFLYSFIFAHNTQRITLPDDFNSEDVRIMYQNFERTDTSNISTPHIFIIMSEAFDELAMDDRFNFEGFTHPLQNWINIINREDVIYGHIIAPNLGGGTGDTEFDVLTAFNTRHLRGTTYSYMLVRNYFESIPSILNTLGYRSIALHPGFPWFYNRQNVYRYFGFEHFYHIEYFDYTHFKGPYVSEIATMDKLITIFRNHLEEYPNVPFFNFTLTIQNHGPYAGLYGLPEDYINFNTDINFNENEISQLTNFFHGLIDIDEQLFRIFTYFEEHSEPIVILYYSDHRPGFTSSIYDILFPETEPLDSLENIKRLHKVPFIIWQNEAASKITNLNENRNNLFMPENMLITSNFLGAYLMELLNFNGLSPFFDFVNELRTMFTIITEDFIVDRNGLPIAYFDTHTRTLVNLYRDWQFDRIFNR
ncbi:MAG: LTA synthase family protein [Defluviitaleaceae bacterium]|nr:LTA synthase family protein [Defluviitaleaceae bacterium]